MRFRFFKSDSLLRKLFLLTLLVAVVPLGLSWMYFFYLENQPSPGPIINSSTVFYGLLVLAFVMAGWGAYYFSRHIIKPIRHFKRSATEIARGNFHHKVEVQANDEIGRLAKIFNYMCEELRRLHDMNLNKIINEKHKTETILKHIADGVIVTDADNRILLMNYVAEHWFGPFELEIAGAPIEELLNNRRLIKFIRGVSRNGEEKHRSMEIVLDPRNGWKKIVLQAHAARIVSEENELIGIVTVLRDVTREKEIDRMKTELVSMVAHELRSPLTSISGFSELLLDSSTSREQAAEYAQIILKESNRLSELINKFLDISKIEAGKSQVRRTPVDMKALVEKVLSFNAQQAQRKEIRVDLQAPQDVSTVYVDRDMFEQVLLNLYSNAIKYSPDKASLTVHISETADDVHIAFQDTGYGISEEALPRIFDKFYRVSDNDQISEITGSGLGLSLVKQIVEIHGGKIQVQSKLGEGSTFTVVLPKTDAVPMEQTDEMLVS